MGAEQLAEMIRREEAAAIGGGELLGAHQRRLDHRAGEHDQREDDVHDADLLWSTLVSQSRHSGTHQPFTVSRTTVPSAPSTAMDPAPEAMASLSEDSRSSRRRRRRSI